MNLIKSFKIELFKYIYKRAEQIEKIKNLKEIKVLSIKFLKKYNYNVYFIPNGRVFTTSVHDTAYFYKNLILSDISYQYRYNKKSKIYNDKTIKNFVIKNGTPKILKKINGNVLSTLCGGAAKNNYWHWIFDILPKIFLIKKLNLIKKIDFFLIPAMKKKFQFETFKSLNIPKKKILNGEKFKHLECKNIIVTDHPIVSNNDPSKSMLNIPIWIIEYYKKNFLKKKYIDNKFPKKIFINRKFNYVSERKIENIDEVLKCVKKLGFKIINLSNFSFLEQIKLFLNAKFIVGLHDAGFANLIFSKYKTKVLEIKSKQNGDVIKNLALKCNLNYSTLHQKNIQSNLKFQSSKIVVDINKLNKKLKNF